MNPTVPELLMGSLVAISEPPNEDSAGDFTTGKFVVLGLLSFLCAQEAEKGAATRHAENEAMRRLFADAAREAWAPELSLELERLSNARDDDLTLTGLDAANAELRHALIRLQEAVEAVAHTARQRRILQLLVDHARARALTLPGEPASP